MNLFPIESLMSDLLNGNILSLTGASGAGKTTLIRALVFFLGHKFARLIPSNTTRPFRQGKEMPGEYRRITLERLAYYKLLNLLAWPEALVHGHTYCTLFPDLRRALATPGISMFALIEEVLQALEQLIPPDQLTMVYILSPPEDILVRRLRDRGEKDIDRRIAECRAWDARALSNSIGYRFIENDRSIEWAVRQLLDVLPLRAHLMHYSRGSRIHTI